MCWRLLRAFWILTVCEVSLAEGAEKLYRPCVLQLASVGSEVGRLDDKCVERLAVATRGIGNQHCWDEYRFLDLSFQRCCGEEHTFQGNPTCFMRLRGTEVHVSPSYFTCCFPQRAASCLPRYDFRASLVEALISHVQMMYIKQGCDVSIAAWQDNAQISTNCGDGPGGIGRVEVELILRIAQRLSPRRIFVLGNGFGWSTFVLAAAFPNASIDVLDAEASGDGNRLGSVLTNAIAAREGLDVRLTIGMSPRDTAAALRGTDGYDLVFIDGDHVEAQMYADFEAIFPYTSPHAVVLFHDVDNAQLNIAVAALAERYLDYFYLQYTSLFHRNSLGVGFMAHNKEWSKYCDLGYEPAWLMPMRGYWE